MLAGRGLCVKYLPGWIERLESVPPARPRPSLEPVVPVDVPAAAGRVHVARTAEEAERIVRMLQAMDVSAISLDSEFGYGAPALPLRNGRPWFDIRAQRPVCFSFAALANGGGGAHLVLGVFDVRQQGVSTVLGELLRLRVPFVFHHSKSELFSLWSLGLDPSLPNIVDTHLAAACLHLGRHHKRAVRRQVGEGEGEAEAGVEQRRKHLLSLTGQCEHYGLVHPHAGAKDHLRDRFLELGDGALGDDLIDYAVADAEFTLRVYCAQQPDILRAGLHAHLHTIEYPFACTNARIEWNGVGVSRVRLDEIRQGAGAAVDHYAAVLADNGVVPPGSRPRFLGLMGKLGLRQLCRRDGRESTAEEVLEAIEGRHPAIRAFRLYQRYRRLSGEEWLRGALIGADGRLHPVHGQLGAATGRNTCRTPNLAGIGKILRPVVVAPPGRALVELDYSQVEVGVAAAEHGDDALIGAYNSGDVYSAMAQRFYARAIPDEHMRMPVEQFKRVHGDLRDRMKTFVLAVLYNIQPPAIAARFGVSLAEASRERERFLDLYPALKQRLMESAELGAVRGYATTVTGLRRLRATSGRADTWTKNAMRNTPIQGSAAVVFKCALIELDRAFRGSSTMLVLPVHDSILIECDEGAVGDVVDLAQMLMCHTLHRYYPALRAKVDVNRADTSCWNKDGRSDTLRRFLDDPDLRFDGLGPRAAH